MTNDRRPCPDFWAGGPTPGSALQEQLAALGTAYDDALDLMLAATESLMTHEWTSPTGCPGWDVHDQLAHCIGVERCLLDESPTTVPPRPPDQADGQSLLLAVEADVLARRGVSHEVLWHEAALTFGQRQGQLQRLEAEVLDEAMVGPGGVRSRGARMLRLRIFDLVAHEQDIRRALGRPREPDGTAAGLVAEHLLRSWRRHWRRDVPGPGVLTVEIEGPRPASMTVALTGDGQGMPRACLRGPLSSLLPLACGRSDAPDGAALFAGGDERLARRAIAAAGITP